MSSRCVPLWPAPLLVAALLIALGKGGTLQGAGRTWIGGNADWDANDANWNPADEPDADDVAVFATANLVDLGMSNNVLGLRLEGGADLNTNGYDLNTGEGVLLFDAGVNLLIGGSTSTVLAQEVTVNAGATLRMTGGTLAVFEAGAGNGAMQVFGTLAGNGVIELNDGGVPLVLFGSALNVTSNGGVSDPFGFGAATLRIDVAQTNVRIDLDNNSGAGTPLAQISIARNDTLEVNGLLDDPYGGTLNLAAGSTIDMGEVWLCDTGTINVNTGGVGVGTAGAAATIAGATFTLVGGTLKLDDIDSLRFSAPFNTTTGTIQNAGLLIFSQGSTVTAGTDFQMTGASASLTVDAGVAVNIHDANFNADGAGTATNVITIHGRGVLDLDLGAGADESLTGVINLNGGELDVTTADNTWAIDGDVNVGGSSGTSRINGDAVTFTSATVTVGTGSVLEVDASSVWTATGDLVLNGGATLRSAHSTSFGGAIQSIGGPSTLTVTGTALLKSTSTAALSADLHLNNTITAVEAGAAFSGGGSLVNLPGRELLLADAANVGVRIENRGVLQINGAADGRVDVAAFQQSTTGRLNIDLAGTGLSDFDQLVVAGGAQIAGTLDLALIGGYVPLLANPPVTILTSSGVTGAFAAIIQPATMPAGLRFDVIYTATAIELQVAVVPSFTADFDEDGDVDGNDLARWRDGFGTGSTHIQGNADSDNDVDGADFLAWQRQLGSSAAATLFGTLPEPATLTLVALAAAIAPFWSRSI